MDDLGELTSAWAHGWAVSRGAPPPTAVLGGLRIDVEGTRHVLAPGDFAAAGALGRSLTRPGAVIKLVGSADRLRAALTGGWDIADVHHLMAAALTRGVLALPPSCTAEVEARGDLWFARIRDADGEVLSSAQLAVHGRYGIVDRVRTRTDAQRRGLGRAVMTTLVNRAVDEGLTTGVLSATVEGRLLYASLGWEVRGELAGGTLRSADGCC